MKYNPELSTKVEEHSPRFPTASTRPQMVDGLGAMIFEQRPVSLNTAFLGRLQLQRKIKFWGCLSGILPLC
jgi:hypothetical protein